jgi:hypothetical protein
MWGIWEPLPSVSTLTRYTQPPYDTAITEVTHKSLHVCLSNAGHVPGAQPELNKIKLKWLSVIYDLEFGHRAVNPANECHRLSLGAHSISIDSIARMWLTPQTKLMTHTRAHSNESWGASYLVSQRTGWPSSRRPSCKVRANVPSRL